MRYLFSNSARPIFRAAIILTLLFTVLDSSLAEDRGGYAGTFLRLGLGARAKGMGGAFVGNPNDGYSSYYNPAGLGRITQREILLSYRNLSLDRTFHFVGYAAPLPPTAGIAVGWISAGVDNIDGRDFSGNHTEMYSDNQNGILFAFGLRLPADLSVGVGGTYLRETLVGITATGFGINLGLQYTPLEELSFGIAARDLGAHYSWNSESLYEHGSSTTDDFPAVFTFGSSYTVRKYKTSILMDIFKNSKSQAGIRFGIENRLLDNIDIRAGIDDGDFTAGAGIRFPMMKSEGILNYAFGTSDIDPGAVHILSFSILLNKRN